MSDVPKRMVSIWTWSALILAVYGVILLCTGLVRLASGEVLTTAMAHLRADIWWPVIILAVAGGLFFAGRREQRGE